MRKSMAMPVVVLIGLATSSPADASIFELYVRGAGGFQYLDMTALDYGGALDPANYDTLQPSQQEIIDNMTKNYKGEGWLAGASVGFLLLNFLDVGLSFRQCGLYFDNGVDADLTELVLQVAWHTLGTDLIFDPSFLLGLGYSYLTTPGATLDETNSAVPGEEVTTNGFIARLGAALDLRFVSWLSVGAAVNLSLLYFDAGPNTSWGYGTDVLARMSIHI